MIDLEPVRRSVVRLDGHFADPKLAENAFYGTAFLVRRPGISDKVWIVTNAHCVQSFLSRIDLLAFSHGKIEPFYSVRPSEFRGFGAEAQDLAIAELSDIVSTQRAYEWNIFPIRERIPAGMATWSFGYPDDSTNFVVSGGATLIESKVIQETSFFPNWGTNFFVENRSSPGRSGSPVYTMINDQPTLIGINRGRVEASLGGGAFAPPVDRVVSTDHLLQLFDEKPAI